MWYKEGYKVSKATDLSGIISAFERFPLSNENYDDFYIDTREARGSDVIQKITKRLLPESDKSTKLLFSGHTGSGKSTELLRLKEELCGRYHVVNVSAVTELDTHNVRCVDVIMAIINGIVDYLEANGIDCVADSTWETLLSYWDSSSIKETVIGRDTGIDALAGLTASGEASCKAGAFGANFKVLSKFVAKAKGILKTYSSTKETIRTVIEPGIGEFLRILNLTIQSVNSQLDKPILVIFEDLDKLGNQAAENVFVEGRAVLAAFQVSVIFTMPISLVYSVNSKAAKSSFDDCYTLEMIKTKNMDGTLNQQGLNTLKQIVERRMDLSLIEADALDFVVEKSGGVIRDLFWMMTDAALNASVDNHPTITMDDMQASYQELRVSYRRSLPARKYLTRLYRLSKNPRDIEEDEVFLELLNNTAIIEFGNGDYCMVHPLLLDYITQYAEDLRLQDEE